MVKPSDGIIGCCLPGNRRRKARYYTRTVAWRSTLKTLTLIGYVAGRGDKHIMATCR